MSNYVLARGAANGAHPGTVFMFNADDFRMLDTAKWGYEVLDREPTYERCKHTGPNGHACTGMVDSTAGRYHVYYDRSCGAAS